MCAFDLMGKKWRGLKNTHQNFLKGGGGEIEK